MPATISVLELYDADESADLVDQDNYALQNNGYAPAVAARSLSPLSGRAYDNVEETASVDITGSSGANMLANLAKIARLLDKARRWSQTGQGNVVRLKVQAQGSNLSNPLEAVVLGPPAGWTLPASFNDYLMVDEIQGAPLGWIRRGELLGDEETASSSAANHPAVYTATMSGSHDGVAAAVDVEITGFNFSTHSQINPGILFVSGRESGADGKLRAYNAINMTGGAWTSTNDSSNNPAQPSGNVLRYTPTGTSESKSGTLDLSSISFPTDQARLAVAVTVRNNAASRKFYVRAVGYGYDSTIVQTTDIHVIDGTNYADPQPLLLGFINIRDGVRYVQIKASVDSTSGSPTLDFDQILLLGMDDDGHIVKNEAHTLTSPFITTGGARLFVDHRLYSDLTPMVGVHEDTNGREAAISYEGDSLIILRGDLVDAYWMSCNGSDWIDTDQKGATTIQLALTAKRRPIFTVPA